MRVDIGYDNRFKSRNGKGVVTWDTDALINGHMLLVGKSGTGKTYMLRKMIKQIEKKYNAAVRVHVFDVHGDIRIEGASDVLFSEATQYGFNPLVVSSDRNAGGVRKRVQSFMGALHRAGYKIGSKQEAVLRNILFDVYTANGFFQDRPSSWNVPSGGRKKYPTMDDVVRYSEYKLKAMFLGSNNKAVTSLEKLYRKQRTLMGKLKQLKGSDKTEDVLSLESDIEKQSEVVIDLFRDHLNSLKTGHELDDVIRYDSKDVLKSVVEKLQNLNNIGIFRPERPPFDNRKSIWRYDIHFLSAPEKKLFVSFILEAIYSNSLNRGLQDGVVELVVLDEAHLFFNDDDSNPINMIAKEARKFGLGLICASQSPTHFSDDFLSNVATKMILGIDQMFWDQSVRKLKLDEDSLAWIVAKKSLLLQMNSSGETATGFSRVLL